MKPKKVKAKTCSICKCKDDHISDLRKEIEFLKGQLRPTPQILPAVNLEANYVMDGAGTEQFKPDPKEQEELEKIASEETAILMGNYEHQI